jgi:ABC-type amino acid transport substrate-binding protein
MRIFARRYLFVFLLCLVGQANAALNFTIAITEFYPPFVMQTSNLKLYGFDISLAQRICRDLEVNCIFKPMKFEKLLPSVLLNQVDIAISSLVITEERLKMMNFSIPYMVSLGRLLVNTKTPTKKIDKLFLNGKRIGVQLGTIYIEYLLEHNLKGSEIVYFKTESGQVKALMHNKIDAAILDNPAAIWWSVNSSNLTKVAGQPFQIGKGVGIAISDKNKENIPKINQIIRAWQKDGTFQKKL